MTEKELEKIEQLKLGDIELGREEYKRLYEKGLDLIQTEPEPRNLLLKVLDDYLEHLDDMPAVDLSLTNLDKLDRGTKEKLRSMILFGTQAALIRENAKIQEDLRKANQNYSDLISVVTHEFKNSLTSIYGYNRIIKKRLEEGETENLFEINHHIDRIARNLFGLVETLFSMSLIDQGHLEIEPRVFDLTEDSINPVINELDLRLTQKSMRVVIKSKHEKNIFYGDERFFQLIFRNLIQNAIQYGYSNTDIEIELKHKSGKLIISVFNQGSGLSKKNLEHVFEKFSRFHTSSEKVNVGIGLFAVKNIIELHKGTITAESEPSKWMKFTIQLPLDIQKKEEK